jgi:hypothetical protein
MEQHRGPENVPVGFFCFGNFQGIVEDAQDVVKIVGGVVLVAGSGFGYGDHEALLKVDDYSGLLRLTGWLPVEA